ncbi:MAG: hypothetical protein IPJ38_06350 [Dechloromonas sp.]|uniref:Uncharacterized protein n=1 Tax=Candidatus Dechloromonas phosphorivorans TaxID=2899244 RepID=A0A935K318_9RHOO|nr:hypothetical protein [Candidatus Dechloromonas phosphorivorans]
MSFDYSNLPARLKDRPGFIGFNRFPVENGKTKKLPVSLITGKAINAHDSKHHHSFKEALRLYMAGAPATDSASSSAREITSPLSTSTIFGHRSNSKPAPVDWVSA